MTKLIFISQLLNFCRYITFYKNFYVRLINKQKKLQVLYNKSKWMLYHKTKKQTCATNEGVWLTPNTQIAGYVSEIAKLLANHERREFKEISDRYHAKVPPPLSSQFETKLPREQAIEKFKVQQQKEAIPLFPSGK